ncbi:hypothetical protein ABID65_003320 [Bradyrhizobium sp. S3.9.2]|uniref:hypothetical protein n=1 Tax=Bradyrhizobium sp. S3.9.2 TaxID=3156432 RepID=UPI00339A3BF7
MNFNDAELAVLASGVVRIGVFFRLDVEPEPVRLWLGFGDIEPGVDIFDPAGARYRGLGQLTNVPAFRQLLNGAAERVEFAMSGVSGDVFEKAITSGDEDAVKGRPATVGFGLFGDRWDSLLGGLHWCAYYVADYLVLSQTEADGEGNGMRSVALSCSTRFTGRRRPSLAYFTDQDQQARHPGDLSCSLTPQYAHGFNKTWPVFS